MTHPAAAIAPPPIPAAKIGRVGVGVLGATGYAGAELVRLLRGHPAAAVLALGSRQHAGELLSRHWPSMPDLDIRLEAEPERPEAWRERGVDVIFSALPHTAFASRAEAYLRAGLRVVDLSADFRLRDAAEYRRRYGAEHPAPHLLDRAVYGLTEWCGPELEAAELIANPGCYATAVLLAALPALAGGWLSGAPILANALSGVSGAGRTPSLSTHFVECGGSAAPYKVAEDHPHMGEMLQAMRRAAEGTPSLVFNPHLVPMARGILATVALPLARKIDPEQARALYLSRYSRGDESGFVRVLETGQLPETRHVRGSNRCDLGLRVCGGGRQLLVFAALDNLVKGAAGQAIQNWNRAQGWPEATGLPLAGWTCA